MVLLLERIMFLSCYFPYSLNIYLYIIATTLLILIIIFVRRTHTKYHFDSKNCVEVYVGNRETYRTSKVQYPIGKNVTWKLISKTKISLVENAQTVFVLT